MSFNIIEEDSFDHFLTTINLEVDFVNKWLTEPITVYGFVVDGGIYIKSDVPFPLGLPHDDTDVAVLSKAINSIATPFLKQRCTIDTLDNITTAVNSNMPMVNLKFYSG